MNELSGIENLNMIFYDNTCYNEYKFLFEFLLNKDRAEAGFININQYNHPPDETPRQVYTDKDQIRQFFKHFTFYMNNKCEFYSKYEDKQELQNLIKIYILTPKKSKLKKLYLLKCFIKLNEIIKDSFRETAHNPENELFVKREFLIHKTYKQLAKHDKMLLILSVLFHFIEKVYFHNLLDEFKEIFKFNGETLKKQFEEKRREIEILIYKIIENNIFYDAPTLPVDSHGVELCRIDYLIFNNPILKNAFFRWFSFYGQALTAHHTYPEDSDQEEDPEEFQEDWEDEEEEEPEEEEKTEREEDKEKEMNILYINNNINLKYTKYKKDNKELLIYYINNKGILYDVKETRGGCSICLEENIYIYEFAGSCCPSSFCLSCIYKTNKGRDGLKCLICRNDKKQIK